MYCHVHLLLEIYFYKRTKSILCNFLINIIKKQKELIVLIIYL